MCGTSKFSHDALVGAGLSNMFINQMKLQGWMPISEYFKMRSEGIDLDWVLVLTMEKNNGFIAIPMVAEYCIPHKDTGMKPGWYKDDIDNPNKRIDDWTNVIMFKLIEDKNTADDIRNEMLDEFEKKENIENVVEYEESFNNTVIDLCNADSEHYIHRMLKKVN